MLDENNQYKKYYKIFCVKRDKKTNKVICLYPNNSNINILYYKRD